MGGPGVGKADLVRACCRFSAVERQSHAQSQPQSCCESDGNHNHATTIDKTYHPGQSRSLVEASEGSGGWSDWTLAGSSLTGAQLGLDTGHPSERTRQAGSDLGLDAHEVHTIASNAGETDDGIVLSIVDGIVDSIVDGIGILDADGFSDDAEKSIKGHDASRRGTKGGGGGGWVNESMGMQSICNDYKVSVPLSPIDDKASVDLDPLFALRPSFHCDVRSANTGFQVSQMMHLINTFLTDPIPNYFSHSSSPSITPRRV